MDTNNKDALSKTVGAILSDLRKKKGVSQNQLADLTGVSKSSISHYEIGETLPPIDILIKFADYYDVTLDYIFGRCYSDYNFSKLLKAKFDRNLTQGEIFQKINNLNSKGKNYLAETIELLENCSEYCKKTK